VNEFFDHHSPGPNLPGVLEFCGYVPLGTGAPAARLSFGAPADGFYKLSLARIAITAPRRTMPPENEKRPDLGRGGLSICLYVVGP
jgi:hypothetical protein